MTPVNSKSLLHFIFDQMDKLDNNKITVEDAKAQANLAKQANNILKYELDRTNTIIKLKTFNKDFSEHLELRNIEGKLFD